MRDLKLFAKSIAVILLTLGIYHADIDARKIRTKLPVKKESVAEATEAESLSSTKVSKAISLDENDSSGTFGRINRKIRFYGFDKTVSSAKESFFISNGIDSTLTALTVEITYFDMQRRQLHQSVYPLECQIPAGETRRVDIKSWDTQKSFYFHQSAKPRRQATPFDVTIRLKSATLLVAEQPVVD